MGGFIREERQRMTYHFDGFCLRVDPLEEFISRCYLRIQSLRLHR